MTGNNQKLSNWILRNGSVLSFNFPEKKTRLACQCCREVGLTYETWVLLYCIAVESDYILRKVHAASNQIISFK